MRRRHGPLLIVLSAVAFGCMAIFARFAYDDGVDPVSLLALRFGIAAAAMWGLMAWRRRPAPRGGTLVALALMGAIGYVGQSLSYFTALTMASAGLVALLLYLYPVMVTVLSAVFLGERLTRAKAVALGLALAGTALTIGPPGGGRMLGIGLGVLCAVIYSVYILVGSKVSPRAGAIPATAVIMTSAAVVYWAICAVRGFHPPRGATGWVAVLALALVSTVVASVTFFEGLERVGPTTAATLSALEPAVTVALAVTVLGEPLTWMGVVGGALILAAVVGLARAGQPDESEASVPPH
jgi:drug/metabolite transporter (DMT)-like permease